MVDCGAGWGGINLCEVALGARSTATRGAQPSATSTYDLANGLGSPLGATWSAQSGGTGAW